MEISQVEAGGLIEGLSADILRLEDTLSQAPLWRPGSVLIGQCRSTRQLISSLKERLSQRIVITLIGPSGSGKSTMINALTGMDDLSETGAARPTTRKILLFSQPGTDMEGIAREMGLDHVDVQFIQKAGILENMVLVDTPDTDSAYLQEHRKLLSRVISVSDVLICLFDAENPKRKDHTDYLAPFVERFDGESLMVALNKCDRLGKEELVETIFPEFKEYIESSWGASIHAVFCISGRSHLKNPRWDSQTLPRNDVDQFDAMMKTIRKTFAQEGYGISRRLKNAQKLWDHVFSQVQMEASKDRDNLSVAVKRLHEIDHKATEKAISALHGADSSSLLYGSVRIYQELVQHWTGPVGWLIAIWCRLVSFGSGMASLLRFRKPVRQIKEWLSNSAGKNENNAETRGSHSRGLALWEYRFTVIKEWGEVASLLIQARFDPSVRRIETFMEDKEGIEDYVSSMWNLLIADEIQRSAEKLSGIFTQFLFNAPVLGVTAYAAWITIKNFLLGTILPVDFFLHAFSTIGITLLLSFFVFQGLVRVFVKKRRIEARALQAVNRLADTDGWFQESSIARQVGMVLDLPR